MAEKGTMTVTFEPTLDAWKLLEGKPIEYIVVNPVTVEAKFKDGEVRRYPQEIRERIVRCRDCSHCHHVKYGELRGRFGTVPAREVYSCGRNGEYRYFDVEPNGFCAWGEEREA